MESTAIPFLDDLCLINLVEKARQIGKLGNSSFPKLSLRIFCGVKINKYRQTKLNLLSKPLNTIYLGIQGNHS